MLPFILLLATITMKAHLIHMLLLHHNGKHWKCMGLFFLPAAGMRYATTVERVQDVGMYWTAGPSGPPIWRYVYYVQFYGGTVMIQNYCRRGCGLSVRLVRDAE